MAGIDLIDDLRTGPKPALAIARYGCMARNYDASCWRIEPLRALAIQSLALQPGDRVIDVACGAGSTGKRSRGRPGRPGASLVLGNVLKWRTLRGKDCALPASTTLKLSRRM